MSNNTFLRASAFSILCLAFLLFAGGCATVGQDFDTKKAQALDIGSMHDADFRAAFGEQTHSDLKDSNSDGSYEEVVYLYAKADLFKAQAKQLSLEFKDGLLHGFFWFSSFDDDKTSADPQKAETIKKGQSTKAEVLSIMGNPTGKIKTPTHIKDFEKYNKPENAEFWCWAAIGTVSTFGSHDTNSQVIVVAFDPQGVVSDVITQQQSNAGQ